jgi:hypothetical protein
MSRTKKTQRRESSLFWRAAVVRRASCGLKLQASAAWLARRRRGGARCLSGRDAALELASRARGAAMVMALALPKNAATAIYSSPSARGRGATCQLRPPISSQRRVARAAQASRRSLSLGRRRSARACFARARCRAGCDRFVSRRKIPHRRDGSLSWRAAVV